MLTFWQYIGKTRAAFEADYVDTGLVDVRHHESFPLNIYSYSRKCQHEDHWDSVTTKCRGIVVNRETGEIVARPFEKFFNYGQKVDSMGEAPMFLSNDKPVMWEKVDGFMCTLYRWEGKPYIASKGSFDSPHAKWATAWYRDHVKDMWPSGWTPVFEGITPNLRIVIDYGKVERMVLLAVINNETGAEVGRDTLAILAEANGITVPKRHAMSLDTAVSMTLGDSQNEEGFVATWPTTYGPPYRLKLKYVEYLRLHRLATAFSPKRVLEALANGWDSVLDDAINNSPQHISHFIRKWRFALEEEKNRLLNQAAKIFDEVDGRVTQEMGTPSTAADFILLRKKFAAEFTAPGNKLYSGILFAMLDGKDVNQVIWKMMKRLTILKSARPLVDAHAV